jgi:hypothetical protein
MGGDGVHGFVFRTLHNPIPLPTSPLKGKE